MFAMPTTMTVVAVSLLATVGLLAAFAATGAPVWALLVLAAFAATEAAALLVWMVDRYRGRDRRA